MSGFWEYVFSIEGNPTTSSGILAKSEDSSVWQVPTHFSGSATRQHSCLFTEAAGLRSQGVDPCLAYFGSTHGVFFFDTDVDTAWDSVKHANYYECAAISRTFRGEEHRDLTNVS